MELSRSRICVFGGKLVGFKFRRLAIAGPLLAVLSCSPKNEAPTFNNPYGEIDTQACRQANLNLQTLDPEGVRGLATCLNGTNNAIKPFKDFLDHIETSDLEVLLSIYNKHVTGEALRLNKILDVVDRMRSKGFFKPFMRDLQVLTETGTLQALLPVVSRLMESENKKQDVNQNIKILSRFMASAIEKNLIGPTIVAAADVFGGLRARVLAILLSEANPNSIYSSEQIVDMFSKILLSSFDDNTFHAALTHSTDPKFLQVFRANSEKTIEDFSDLFTFLPEINNSMVTAKGNRMERLTRVVRGADRPMKCYKKDGRVRKTDNLLRMIARQSIDYPDSQSGDRFFLQTVPILVAATQESCTYDYNAIENMDVLYEAVRMGYGDGVRAMNRLLVEGNRFDEMAAGLKSPYLAKLQPLMLEVARRGGMPFVVQIFSDDLTDSDIKNVAVLLNDFIVEDIKNDDLLNWVNAFVTPDVRAPLIKEIQSLPLNERSLTGISLNLLGRPEKDRLFRDVKNAVAATYFSGGPEQAFISLARQIFDNDPTSREELNRLAKGLIKSMADSRGGFGDLVGVMAQAVGVSVENPIQAVLHDVLADEELVDALSRIVLKVTRDEKFRGAIEFTGLIAGNGQLENLLVFLIDLFKNPGAPGLDPRPNPNQFHKPSRRPQEVIGSIKPFAPHPPKGNFSSCLGIKGSLFEKSGGNLSKTFQCLNATGTQPDLAKLGEELRKANVMGPLTNVGQALVTGSKHASESLDQMEHLLRTKKLKGLLSLFVHSVEPYRIPELAEPALESLAQHSDFPTFLNYVGSILQNPSFNPAVKVFLDALATSPNKIFESRDDFLIPITSESAMKQKIKDWFPSLSSAQVQAHFDHAAREFSSRTSSWLYEEGPYKNYSNEQFRNILVEFFNDLTRGDDLKEFILALKDISKKFPNFSEVIVDMITNHKITRYIDKDGDLRLRIVSQIDQLESLVLDGDMAIKVLGIPAVNHVATKFQIDIAESKNLEKTIDEQFGLISKAKLVTVGDTHRRVLNLIENFEVLRELVASDRLKIFQRLYRGLYDATPEEDRRVQDPKKNHMGALNALNKVGVFQAMTMGLSHAKAKGVSRKIVNSVLKLAELVNEEDIPLLKSALQILLEKQGSQTTPLGDLIDKLLLSSKQSEGYNNLKDGLFHLSVGLDKVFVKSPTALLRSLPTILDRQGSWNDLIETLIEDLESSDGAIIKVGANLIGITEGQAKHLQNLVESISVETPQNKNELSKIINMFQEVHDQNAEAMVELQRALKKYKADPKVVDLQALFLLRSIFESFETSIGLGQNLSEILTTPRLQADLIEVLRVLAQNKDLGLITRLLAQQIKEGNVEAALHFVFDNLPSSSIKSEGRRGFSFK